MSTVFTPDEGTLFYARSVRVLDKIVKEEFGVLVTEKTVDRSYSGSILKAVAHDNRMVIADIVHGEGSHYTNKRVMLIRSDYVFEPVGPAVMDALNLKEA